MALTLTRSETPARNFGAASRGVVRRGLTALRSRPVVAWLIPAGIFLVVLLLGMTNEGLYERLVREDGPIEMATMLAAIATALTAAVVAYHLRTLRRPKWLVLCWAIFAAGSFLLAGEEVSWGQRQFGFSGPDALTAHNLQNETNAHNLFAPWAVSVIYVAIGLYGAGVGHAVLRRLPRVGTFADLLAPPWRSVAAPWFGVHALVYGWYAVVEPIMRAFGSDFALDDHLWKLGEPSELILGIGFLLFSLEALFTIQASPDRRGFGSSPRSPSEDARDIALSSDEDII